MESSGTPGTGGGTPPNPARPPAPADLPELRIPASGATVEVSIIDTTGTIRGVDACRFLAPERAGHRWLADPCWAFFVRHRASGRALVFDLGIRRDFAARWEEEGRGWPPPLRERLLNEGGYVVDVPKDVRQILDEGGVDPKSIEAVIWSHWHFDHTGDPTRFEPSTALIVGPGCKEHIFPGYPANPKAAFLESDYAGREVRELDFSSSTLTIGRFPALDYFGDGSFYLLDAPGHAVGHVCGLARATPSPADSFVLMGGDAVHHGGELRPHPWHPLPAEVEPHPFFPGGRSSDSSSTSSRFSPPLMLPPSRPCPGALFEPLLRDGDDRAPFYLPAEHPPKGAPVHHNVPLMIESIRKLQELDAHANVLVVAAHDVTMRGVVDFFPKTANAFVEKGWVHRTRWAFLADFAEAVGYEGELPIEAMGDWSATSARQGKGVWKAGNEEK
ncbi:beta-lactamase-like protein [Xylariaceae sp. FL0804]|nr:beta-lactamase-like protein [Xylariaceae sp. FL0804]